MEEDQKEEQSQQKISLPEIIIMTLIFGGADLFEVLATLIAGVPVVGLIFGGLNWLVDAFCWLVLIVWSILRPGMKGIWMFVGGLLELIPGIDALPLRTTTLYLAVFLTNRPIKLPEPLEKAAGKTVGIAGRAGKTMPK